MRYKLLALIAIFWSIMSCGHHHGPFTTGRIYYLEPRWQPLVAVVEGTDKVFAQGAMTTIGHYSYVPDLAQWQRDYPPGSADFEAILRHEQLHSVRELVGGSIGEAEWLAKYAAEPSFRWSEEQLGYETQIRYLYSQGLQIDPQAYATILSSNYAGMVSYNDAYAWLTDLIQRIQKGP